MHVIRDVFFIFNPLVPDVHYGEQQDAFHVVKFVLIFKKFNFNFRNCNTSMQCTNNNSVLLYCDQRDVKKVENSLADTKSETCQTSFKFFKNIH